MTVVVRPALSPSASLSFAECTSLGNPYADLSATAPGAGVSGVWSMVSGGGGTIDNPSNSTTLAKGLSAGTTTVRWTLYYTDNAPACSTSVDVSATPPTFLSGIQSGVSLQNSGAAQSPPRPDYYACHECSIKDGNIYKYYGTDGKIIAMIEDISNNNALGVTEVCVGYDYNAPAQPVAGDVETVPTNFGPQPYLPRSWTIHPAAGSEAKVTLYFTADELEALQDKAVGTPFAFSGTNSLEITKYPGGFGGNFTAPKSSGGEFVPSTHSSDGNGNYMVTFTISTFSTIYDAPTIFPGAVLPVELEVFTGSYNEDRNVNELNWITASEINTEKFEVEKSLDAQHWTAIGTVYAQGTTYDRTSYDFDDVNPVTGNNYYRLKIIDTDGTFEYSPVVPVYVSGDVSKNGISQIFPNPTQGTLNVWLTSTKDQTAVFNVHDVLGRNITQISKELKEGTNRLEFNFGNLASGTYIISYIDARGEKHHAKFVKD
jgi:hypothetical protein